ncbi:hypothetical protein K432DRAFT_468093 [Lepidopterella palustris CBS 459.81]|uniref:Uncharacterized protein n=1 Tax=Lepidopterella palustris CBS 459.81 TaxID=1314670 RepID=A0A8E2EKZ3_9PEZI|nr:hypothetical protein K432DRAFT_468093 [Lepidopterella palustris CBS 459.81]
METVHVAFMELQHAVTAMAPNNLKRRQPQPGHVSTLARPVSSLQVRCLLCQFPGHRCDSIKHTRECQVAIVDSIASWEHIFCYVILLQHSSPQFRTFLQQNIVTRDMQLDTHRHISGSISAVISHRLSANYLKLPRFYTRLELKISDILNNGEIQRYDILTKGLNSMFLGGSSCKWPQT